MEDNLIPEVSQKVYDQVLGSLDSYGFRRCIARQIAEQQPVFYGYLKEYCLTFPRFIPIGPIGTFALIDAQATENDDPMPLVRDSSWENLETEILKEGLSNWIDRSLYCLKNENPFIRMFLLSRSEGMYPHNRIELISHSIGVYKMWEIEKQVRSIEGIEDKIR